MTILFDEKKVWEIHEYNIRKESYAEGMAKGMAEGKAEGITETLVSLVKKGIITVILLKSEKLKTSAKNNTVKDFEFSYFDDIDNALIEGLSQNQDFFSMLLSSDDVKKQVLGIFTEEIYKSLREA